jgi:hypothetical protein
MATSRLAGHRLAVVWVFVVAGGALGVATWLGGAHGIAVAVLVFYALCAIAAYLWSGRDSDVGAILRVGGDERQSRIDRDATAIAGLAMLALAIVGAIVSAAVNNGDIGVYGLFGAVGGLAYALSVFVLHRRH